MNARAITSAAGVILAAIKQGRVPAGIACALDAAGMLQSPETAAEVQQLRKQAAETEAYPGELAMLRGLMRVIRTIAQHGDVAELRRLLAEHEIDERASYCALEEKATDTASASVTPHGPLGAGARGRLALLRRAVNEQQGEWTTERAALLYRATYGPDHWRAPALRDLTQLRDEGFLVLHEDPSTRHYTLADQTGGA